MKILQPGHKYKLDHLDGCEYEQLQFVNRGISNKRDMREGTNNQEVLRVLIDRVKYLDNQVPWEGNAKIINHLRMALVLHESRHLERAVELGKLEPEAITTNAHNGHFELYTLQKRGDTE